LVNATQTLEIALILLTSQPVKNQNLIVLENDGNNKKYARFVR
jgi:hypothetical protein